MSYCHQPFGPQQAGYTQENHEHAKSKGNGLHMVDSISSQNFFKSMFPPETMATIGPLPALLVSAAASGKAPAPSAITRAFSAIKRIAALVSFKVTTR